LIKDFCNSLIPSYICFYKQAFDFKGRTSRLEFWAAIFMGYLTTILVVILAIITTPELIQMIQSDPGSVAKAATQTWQVTVWK
tara:strand:- start:397 stop:645 length:249 start_codon:yes stop_codon:yes gene_type:complete